MGMVLFLVVLLLTVALVLMVKLYLWRLKNGCISGVYSCIIHELRLMQDK